MTATTATKDTMKFTKANDTFSKGKSALLIRIFLISGAESIIELIAEDVASDMNVNNVCPKIRYKGKFSMLKRNTVENTAVRTTIIRSGFRTDHSTPSMLRRYFSLKSFDTSERKINQSRFICSLLKFIGVAILLAWVPEQ